MKNLLVAVVILGLTISTTSCSKSDSIDSAQLESQSRAHKGSGSGGDASVPQVTGLSASALNPTDVYLTWNSVAGATSYWIYRNDYVIAIIQNTNYTDKGVSPGTYTYSIAAVVNQVLGPKSTSSTVTLQ
jgi:hypothetical protein